MIESTPGLFIELWTQELKLRALLFGFFTSEFDLETWLEDSEVLRDSEVHLEHGRVSVESEPEDRRSRWVPIVALELLHLGILV
jgi:hypothetical protein